MDQIRSSGMPAAQPRAEDSTPMTGARLSRRGFGQLLGMQAALGLRGRDSGGFPQGG